MDRAGATSGQPEGEVRAALARDGPEGAAVDCRDVVGDGEAETGAAGVAGAGVVKASEAFEDPLMVLGRDAGAIVTDVDNGFTVEGLVGQADGDRVRRVALGVVEEIGEDADEQGLVALHGDGDGTGVRLDVDAARWSASDGLLTHEVGEINGPRTPVTVLCVEAGEEEQVLGQLLYPDGVLVGRVDDSGPVGGIRPVEGKLKFGAERRERSAEFVRGVRCELPLSVHSRLQPRQGGVHRCGELCDLVARPGYRDASVEMVGAELREFSTDSLDRTQSPANREPGGACYQGREYENSAARDHTTVFNCACSGWIE